MEAINIVLTLYSHARIPWSPIREKINTQFDRTCGINFNSVDWLLQCRVNGYNVREKSGSLQNGNMSCLHVPKGHLHLNKMCYTCDILVTNLIVHVTCASYRIVPNFS